MEENLMEKLLNDFNGTLNEFNELVEKNDYDGVRKVLDEVNRLLQERNGIVLDDREPQYDHVLHELLDKMKGTVEKVTIVEGIDGVPGSRYYTNKQVEEMIAEAEAEVKRLSDVMRETEDFNNEAYSQARSQRTALIERIAELRAALVEGQEFSTLTYIDPRLKELQEERARLLQEKQANLEEIARLRAEETPGVPGNPADQARFDEINTRLSELENLFSDIEGQINDIRKTNISQLIDNLRAETSRIPELEARRAELQERLRAAGDRVRETRGFDEQNAQARADYSALVNEIAEVDAEINGINQSQNNIEFLETLLPEVEQTENVLDPMDYTYMGRLSDEQIIRRILSEQLHLSEEEINATIGEYSLVQVEPGAHDEYGEDNPISMRQLVRTRTVKGDITIGEALDSLEAQLYDGPVVDHTQEISEINARIEELDRTISEAEARIEEINVLQISDIIAERQENENRIPELEARRAELQERLTAAGDRVRETRGFDEQNAQARADYSALVNEIAEVDAQINVINQNRSDIEFLETLLPDVEQTENVLDPMDYTYMGRLSDEQIIRRILSEQLHLSEEEINATIGEYSLIQVEPGAHDEQGEDNPISMRQLVRTQKVKGRLTVREGLEKLDQEISELEARRAELEEQLRVTGDRIRETRGFDEQNAQARADYSALVQQISELDAQISNLKERKTRFNNIVGIGREEEIIANAKTEKEALIARRNELEQDSSRQENPEVREKINRIKGISGIAALEAQLQQYKDEYERLQKEKESLLPTPGKPGIDNSKRIAELEARNKEIDARIAEIDKEIEGMSGVVPPRKQTEILDVEKEAHIIGDHIFKTAKIRRELADRNVTREDFLEFYTKGYEMTEKNIQKLTETATEIANETNQLFVDPDSDKTLLDQEEEAKTENNAGKLIAVYEKMRQNFIKNGRYNEDLEASGLLNDKITTTEQAQKFAEFFETYKQLVEGQLAKIDKKRSKLREELEIYKQGIEKIKEEQKTLEIAQGNLDSLKEKVEKEKALRNRQIRATVVGDDELEYEWQQRMERFNSHKVTKKGTYIDKDGNEKEIEYQTVEDYPELSEDAFFLNLEDYKQNLEASTKYRSSGNDPYALGQETGEKVDAAEAKQPGAGKELLENYVRQMEDYVVSHHGFTNDYAVKYATLRTAGSTLKAMKPVRGELPTTVKMGNAISNTFRFFGFRAPKFTRQNEKGETVRDIKGGVLTLATDAAVAAAIILQPAVMGVAYVVKGAVTAGNLIAAKSTKNKHGDEMKLASFRGATKGEAEVISRDYYRQVEGKGRFTSWVKAKSDKYIFRGRSKETLEKIVKLRTELSDKTIDLRNEKAIETAKQNVEIANKNQEIRQRNQQKVSMSDKTYNDIVRDPDSVNMDEATAQIARNALLQSYGKEGKDVNSNSKVERKEQYVKDPEQLEKTENLQKIKTEGGTIAVTAITEEEKYRAAQERQDRINKVLTVIGTALGNLGLNWIRGKLMDQIVTKKQGPDQTVTTQQQVPVYKTRKIKELADPDKRISDYAYDSVGRNDVWGGPEGATGIKGDVDAITLSTRNANGDVIEVSLAEAGKGYTTRHVHALTSENLSGKTIEEAIAALRQNDPQNLEKYLEAVGLPDTATDLDIAKHALENNQFYSQTGAMEGWQKVAESNLVEKTQQYLAGTTTKTITQTIPGKITQSVTNKFSFTKAAQAVADGAILGAAATTLDALHEAAHQTEKMDKGTHEEKNPELRISKIARKAQEELNKARAQKETKEAKQPEQPEQPEQDPEGDR